MKRLCLLLFFVAVLLRADLTPLDDAAATEGNGTSLEYPVGAGTNRYLVCAVACELNCGSTPSATAGGQAMTVLRTCAPNDNARVTALGLNEAGIAAMSGSTVSVSGSGTRTLLACRSYEIVNQSDPVPETDCDHTGSSTPNPIMTSLIDAAAGSAVLSASVTGSGDDAASPPITCTWDNATHRLTESGSSEALSLADTFPASAATVNPQCTWSEQPRAAQVSIELSPAAAPGGGSSAVYSEAVRFSEFWPPPFVVQPQTLPAGEAGEAYTGATITATGGKPAYTWAVSSGALPPGLSLSTDGEITGTVDAAASGNYFFTARATDQDGGMSFGDFVLSVTGSAPPPETPLWVQPYDTWTANRTHYVSPSGTGSGSGLDPDNTESWSTAFGHYTAGDLHVLRAGTYTSGSQVTLSTNCSSTNLCVFKVYIDVATGQPERATFDGGVIVRGSWNWFWGLEFHTLSSTTDGVGAMDMEDSGVRCINCIIHDANGSTIRMFNFGPGQVLYGSVVYRAGIQPTNDRGHSVYTQNDGSANGTKYFVQNYFSFCDAVGRGQCFNAGSSNAEVDTMWLQDNFWWNEEDPLDPRRARINFDPAQTGNNDVEDMHSMTFKNNFVIDVNESNGWGIAGRANAAWQGDLTGNYIARSNIAIQGIWGSPDSPGVTRFENNEIYDAHNGCHYKNIGSVRPGVANGTPKFMDQDVVDNNTFGGTFKACGLKCDGSTFGDSTLAEWRTRTDNCRVTPDAGDANGFDVNSTEVANPTVNKIKVVKNDYARVDGHNWGMVGIVNWEGASSDVVDISPIVGASKAYTVRYARDFFGAPAASGTCPGSGACDVSLETRSSAAGAAGKFFVLFYVTGQP